MTDFPEDVVRRSLDAVDRSRRWMLAGLGTLVLLLGIVFVHGAIAVHHGGDGMTDAVLAHYFILLIWVTILAVLVIIQIATMTKRILKAIELASRR
jgi:uncharacterized membrane protein